ncbi:MAG: alpha-galactosidase [Lentisphaerae bacterium]|nr:alpha-galactosidase [Lentisphaerota bacterium]
MKKLMWQKELPGYRAYLPVELPPEATYVYRGNNNMESAVVAPNVHMIHGCDAALTAQDVVVVGDVASKRYILAGALSARYSLTYFTVIRRGKLCGIEVFMPHITNGREPEKTVVLEGDDPQKLLIEYAEMAAKEMGVKNIEASENMTGYCTWYYYYAGVSEADLLANIDAIRDNRTVYNAKYIQIDDGYQRHQGDWLDQRDAWPTPLTEIAAKIIDAGSVPGIWTMPLLASTASRVYQEHPDWFVKDAAGNTMIIQGWSPEPDNHWVCLDATLDEVLEHLANIFKTFRSWGFAYFKMDGLSYGLMEGVRHDPDATPVSAFRRALEAIRKAVPDAVLLACCAPFMPCMGLVDNCRVSTDTSRYYKSNQQIAGNTDLDYFCSISRAAHLTLANWWKFDRWFRCDPDTMMARQDNAFYSYGEAKISVLTGILSGVATTSDHLGTISPERLALLGRAQNLRMRDVRPVEWQQNRWPQFFSGTVDGKRALAVFNDTEQELVCCFADYGLPETCDEVLDTPSVRKVKIIVPAHDAALLIAGN